MTGVLSILFMLTFIGTNVNCQHLIGLSRNEVQNMMQELGFIADNTTRNSTYNYLKYVDKIEERTLLVFMSNTDTCTGTKLMSNYSSFKSTLGKFNKEYSKISSKEWHYKIDSITYKVSIKKEDWFYTVIVTKK